MKTLKKRTFGRAISGWLVSCLTLTGALPAAAHDDDATDKEAKRIENLFNFRLKNSAIVVKATPLFGDKYVVELTGKVKSTA